MISGLYLTILALLILATPLLDMLRRFGEITDETIMRWMAELRPEQRFRIWLSYQVGFAILAFGLFMLTKPR